MVLDNVCNNFFLLVTSFLNYLPVVPRVSIYDPNNVPKAISQTVRNGCDRIKLQNYVFTFMAGKSSTRTVKAYSPFLAQPGIDWWPVMVSCALL